MHSHKAFGVCCVMDYAGDVKALSELISTDCDVSIQGYISEEFMKVVNSIPSSDNGQALIKELQPYLQSGAKVASRTLIIITCFVPQLFLHLLATHTKTTTVPLLCISLSEVPPMPFITHYIMHFIFAVFIDDQEEHNTDTDTSQLLIRL